MTKELTMILGHSSWNERKLRKQILRSQRRGKKSNFKQLLLIAVALFGLYLLCANTAGASA